ncbi:hypothetical protein L7E55_05790 [Pelotomaculum isophthalicicum JI]|uniref:Uncharacterized protein n=1 Tax=Pelotomaculum isophthalicicum JI TaxID=947010 RepID=A0A9X4H5S2_9FIRM|nr:hypothetical protein [Pelotomaculum isophthalicicum]MDF9407874.1 hypothetical protein [Pelotomaculum isophthalicicum JI]
MSKKEIQLIGLLACLGFVIIIGVYLWRGASANSKEMETSKQAYAKQIEDLQKAGKTDKSTQANSAGAQSTNSTQSAANQTTPAATSAIPNPAPTSTPASTVKSTNSIAAGSKVGDIVKLGDVEMVVTKSTTKYKVIDITLNGNTPDQPPKLLLTENNRIIYEIPADVDVDVNVTEKTKTDQSPLFNGVKKAGN